MEIQCEFVTKDSRYVCITRNIVISQRSRVKSFIGIHEPGKSNENVDHFKFETSTVHFLPKGLLEFFPQLKVLSLFDCQLKEISSKDLMGLENLEYLWLGSNNLTSLPDDLFVHTKKLKELGCKNNQLEFMSSRLFDPIPDDQWVYLGFKINKRIDVYYQTGSSDDLKLLAKLKTTIDASCSPPAKKIPSITRSTTNEFQKLWELKKFADFTIAVESKEIKVHKVVLAVQSPVFASMFENDDQVKATNMLEIKDCSAGAVEEFLFCLYTGEVKDATNVREIFSLACTFDVEELRQISEQIVIENVNEENAVGALQLGNLHESDGIIEVAFRKIDSMLPNKLNDSLKRKPEQVEKIVNLSKCFMESFESLNV